jgi:hypothetical protein
VRERDEGEPVIHDRAVKKIFDDVDGLGGAGLNRLSYIVNVTTPSPPPPRQLRRPGPWIQSPSLGSSIGGPVDASAVTVPRRASAAESLTCWAPSRRFSPLHAGAKCGQSSPLRILRCLRRQSSHLKSPLSDPASHPHPRLLPRPGILHRPLHRLENLA